jgi:hypothetical protein
VAQTDAASGVGRDRRRISRTVFEKFESDKMGISVGLMLWSQRATVRAWERRESDPSGTDVAAEAVGEMYCEISRRSSWPC